MRKTRGRKILNPNSHYITDIMSSRIPSAIPLTREELIKLKHQIKPNDYLVVESAADRILVVRSERELPDIVNDLDGMINKLDIRDTNELTHALIIGEEEVIGVPLNAITSLVERRIEDDNLIAEDLGEKLVEPYTILIFESENDPLKTLRLGIRVEGNLKDFKPQELPEILFSKIKSLPRHSEVVYLIAEDGYIRLSGNEFYRRLREFLQKNPERNKELAREFIYMTRGKLADHFVNKDPYEDLLNTAKQENINSFVSEVEPITPEEEIKLKANAFDFDKAELESEASKVIPPEKPESSTGVAKLEDSEESLTEIKADALSLSEQEAITGDKTVFELKSESESTTKKSWPSVTRFIIDLQQKLSESGFEIMQGVEIPGVDLAAKNPDSIVSRVFFTYMPEFNLKKALTMERSINKFSPELSIMISVPDVDDSEMRLFAVGKNILVTTIDTILNTDLLVRLEEHI